MQAKPLRDFPKDRQDAIADCLLDGLTKPLNALRGWKEAARTAIATARGFAVDLPFLEPHIRELEDELK